LILCDENDDRIFVDALEAGASGFLSKSSPLAELTDAVRSLVRGEILIPSRMMGGLLARLIRRRREQDHALRALSRLTRREREVLRLLAQGTDNDGIAQTLVISPQTARTHVQNVLGKLGVHSRLEAAAFVTSSGLLEELEPERLSSPGR
jgi:DNA-binding NarL/FixJ family response regulator